MAAGLLLVASVGMAQRRGRFPMTFPIVSPGAFNGAFVFCRIAFRNQPSGDGAGWSVDYPRADLNLSFRLSELTKTPISRDALGEINHVVIRLTDPQLYRCPFVMMTEPGGAYFDDAEAASLRNYLLKGGFLWADDFWGTRAWQNWSGEIAKALSPGEYPIVDVPLDHELFHTLYDVHEIPQIPGINFWMFTGGRTSERGADSAVPHLRAIFDGHGRIMVMMTYNTDFGDAFEREGDDHEYFLRFAPPGYAIGVNALVYAMTH
jgi:hypothetical protein